MILDYINKFREKYNQQRGQRFLSRGQREKAYKCFEKALLINNDYVNQFNMALVLIAMARHKEAVAFLERTLEKYPDNELVLTTLGEAYSVLRDWDKALECFMHLTSDHPNNALYQKMLKRSQDVSAREKYARSRELFFKGMNLQQAKDYKGSTEALIESAELDSENAMIYNTIGYVMMMDRRSKEEIIPYFEKAVILSPQNEGYKHNLAQMKLALKNKK